MTKVEYTFNEAMIDVVAEMAKDLVAALKGDPNTLIDRLTALERQKIERAKDKVEKRKAQEDEDAARRIKLEGDFTQAVKAAFVEHVYKAPAMRFTATLQKLAEANEFIGKLQVVVEVRRETVDGEDKVTVGEPLATVNTYVRRGALSSGGNGAKGQGITVRTKDGTLKTYNTAIEAVRELVQPDATNMSRGAVIKKLASGGHTVTG
jgi:hypothetical protein